MCLSVFIVLSFEVESEFFLNSKTVCNISHKTTLMLEEKVKKKVKRTVSNKHLKSG